MDIERLFDDRVFLENEIRFFRLKKHIMTIKSNPELVRAHLKKARHNLEFFKLNRVQHRFNDWLIVVLYYTLYHAALALITKKNCTSKNHYATMLILIKEFSITKDEANLLDRLSISKEDAELYTQLKNDRHGASYSTGLLFSDFLISEYEGRVMDFVNKTEELVA